MAAKRKGGKMTLTPNKSAGGKKPVRAGAGPARGRLASCPACRKPLRDGGKVCPACGAVLDPAAVRQA